MSILLFIIIFLSISAISGSIVMGAVCVNRGPQMGAAPGAYMESYRNAPYPSGMIITSEKNQGLKMALNAEFEPLIIQGE